MLQPSQGDTAEHNVKVFKPFGLVLLFCSCAALLALRKETKCKKKKDGEGFNFVFAAGNSFHESIFFFRKEIIVLFCSCSACFSCFRSCHTLQTCMRTATAVCCSLGAHPRGCIRVGTLMLLGFSHQIMSWCPFIPMQEQCCSTVLAYAALSTAGRFGGTQLLPHCLSKLISVSHPLFALGRCYPASV